MAGNNSIKILRGTKANINKHNLEILEKGQPLYETDERYLYVGNGETTLANRNSLKVYAGYADRAGGIKTTYSIGDEKKPVYVNAGGVVTPISHTIESDVPENAFSLATTSSNGLMSSSDKSKLDGIATGANKYVLPQADKDTLGGVKLGYSGGGDRDYKVQANTGGNLYVNVPWTNTTYSAGTGLTLDGTTFKHSNSIQSDTAKGDNSKTLTVGGTFTIPSITYDAQGHITGKSTTTMTMPSSYAVSASTSTSRLFLVGVTGTGGNKSTNTNASCYIDSNTLYSNSKAVLNTGTTLFNLNGSDKSYSSSPASFYAPTSAGTSEYILQSSGSGAPTWFLPSSSSNSLYASYLTSNTQPTVYTVKLGNILIIGGVLSLKIDSSDTPIIIKRETNSWLSGYKFVSAIANTRYTQSSELSGSSYNSAMAVKVTDSEINIAVDTGTAKQGITFMIVAYKN